MADQHHEHSYPVRVTWTGNRGNGTSGYAGYDRAHEIAVAGKTDHRRLVGPRFSRRSRTL